MGQVYILQHVWGDPPGLFEELLRANQLPYKIVEVEVESPPSDVDDMTALVVLGGLQYAGSDSDPLLNAEKELMRRAMARDIPILGICLGGQLLASACGAVVVQGQAVQIGFYENPLTEAGVNDAIFQGIGAQHQVFHWHNDGFYLPDGGVLLEEGPTEYCQAFRYGRRAYGVQYHPELTPDMLHDWISRHPQREQAVALLGEGGYQRIIDEIPVRFPVHEAHARLLFNNFLKIGELV
jgi:GMP synthase-like glutamine amidotransferase